MIFNVKAKNGLFCFVSDQEDSSPTLAFLSKILTEKLPGSDLFGAGNPGKVKECETDN